ncbi:methylamine utilization protein [Halioglobus maricola]|uniref:Methylamine utilization protein n=1 Tax=Halioglobus maricola TaxID=2601894 RepID=A0A5P9NLY0_9GAMM|nr:methylamine utilization protein [Halioglobus maricola]
MSQLIRKQVLLALTVGLVCSAALADLSVALRSDNSDGPISLPGAVISAVPLDSQLSEGVTAPPRDMAQENRQFRPYILATQVGAPVHFPNRDPIAHHVYSFSQTKTFELPLYREDTPEPIIFNEPGVVPLGCNIHDWMLGYIVVVDTPFYTQMTGAEAVLKNLPPGEYEIAVWHPSLHPEETLGKIVTVTGKDQLETLVLHFKRRKVSQPEAPEPRLDEWDDY